MARIVLTTYGSSGDLNPIVALGLGLQARGHAVLIAVEEAHRPAVGMRQNSESRWSGAQSIGYPSPL